MSNAINLTAIIISSIALVTSLISIILVLAQKWSTHHIEWKPLQMEDVKEEPVIEEVSDEDFLEQALKLNKKKKKDVDPLSDIESTNF